MTTAHDLIMGRLSGGYNDWPDLPIVKVETWDLNDPKVARQYGYMEAKSEVRRAPTHGSLPALVRSYLPKAPDNYAIRVDFLYARSHGWVHDDVETRNILAIMAPYHLRGPEIYPAVVVELGCAHEFKGTSTQRGWHSYTCVKCGHHYEDDSSG